MTGRGAPGGGGEARAGAGITLSGGGGGSSYAGSWILKTNNVTTSRMAPSMVSK